MNKKFLFPMYSFFFFPSNKVGTLSIITNFQNFNKFWTIFSNFYFLNEKNRDIKSHVKQHLSYSTKKLRRQKHSGKARLGTHRSPLLRGGKKVFGPCYIKKENKINYKLTSIVFNQLLILISCKLLIIKLPKLTCQFDLLLEFLKYNLRLFTNKTKLYYIFPFSQFNIDTKNINYSSYSQVSLAKLLLAKKIILFV